LKRAIFIFLILSKLIYAQPDSLWSGIYDYRWQNDECRAACITNEYEILLAGYSTIRGTSQALVMRIDSDGEKVWERLYGREIQERRLRDQIYGISEMTDSSIVFVGETNSYGDHGTYNGWVMRVTENGDSLWSVVFPSVTRELYDVAATPDSGCIVCGLGGGEVEGGSGRLLKLDKNGELQWIRGYGGSSNLKSVVMTRDGGYAATGRTSSLGAGMHDFYLVKTDERGEIEWQETYGTVATDRGETLIQTEDGGYFLGGKTLIDNFEGNYWVVKTDSLGEMEWESQFGYIRSNVCYSVFETNDHGFIAVGEGGSPDRSHQFGDDFFIVRTDSAGNMLWELFLGIAAEESCIAGFTIENDSYAFCGEIVNNFWIVKTGPDPVLNGINEPPEVYYPGEILLHDIYPNPFNSSTTINYTLPKRMSIKLGVYDLMGRKLDLFEHMYKHAGKHQFIWDAGDVPSGQYLIKLEAQKEISSKSVMLIR